MERTLEHRIETNAPVVERNVKLLKELLPMFAYGDRWSTTYFTSPAGAIEYVGRYEGSDDRHRTRWSQWAVMRGVREDGRLIIESMHVPGHQGPYTRVLEETMRQYNEAQQRYGRDETVMGPMVGIADN